MAGKIIADTIEASGSQISLNVGNVTILTASSTGLTLIPTTNVNVNLTNSIVTLTSGNVARPSLTFSGNTTTGIFMPAANTIAFGTAGTEDMRIDSAGNVGIGNTPSGTYKLEVNGSIYGVGFSAVGNATLNRANATAYNVAGGIQLQIDGTTYAAVRQPAAEVLAFYRGSGGTTETARIDSSGNLLLGGTSPVTTNERFFIDQPTTAFWGQSFKLGNSANGIIFTNTFELNKKIKLF